MSRTVPCARALLVTAVATASFATMAPAHAQQLEEVIVTAQKRVESLQDVPISITAVSGEKMEEAGIFKIEDLQALTPNLSMTETGISTQIYIRGIGSGNNQGFEQSVGQYVDGIYYGRQQLLRTPFLDLERVEVLRGPQSILFGKNSIAGALNMTTAKPTDTFEGRLSGKYSPDGDITEFTGMINGPLTDDLYGRLVARQYNEDGWMENTVLDNDEPERDEFAIRGSLLWNASDALTIGFKAEYDEFDVDGRQIEIVQDDPAVPGSPIPGLTFGQILGIFGYPEGIAEAEQNNKRQRDEKEFSENEIYNYTLNIDWQLGENTLTATTGLVGYEFHEACDCDFVAAPIIDVELNEDYDQFSQEIRLASPGGETIDWIAGVFYQESELDYSSDLVVPENAILGAVSPALQPLNGTGGRRYYESDSELWAAFGQATWNISDDLRLTLGARYTDEEKEAYREVVITEPYTDIPTSSPIAPTLWFAVFGVQSQQIPGHFLEGDRDEGVFTPLVNLQWDVTEDIMLYAAYSTGFKSGGFDSSANFTASWEFEEEEATTYEVGMKSFLLDNSLELNAAAYYTDYDDLQVSQFDGTLGFTVGNAAETRVWGVEVDGRWAITDNLTAGYGMAYLDHEYKDYTNGNCYNFQVPDGDVVGGEQLCDYTGKRGQYTPEWTGFASLNHAYPLTGELMLNTSVDMSYTDEQNTHVNLDPQWEVDDITLWNFRIGCQPNTGMSRCWYRT